MSKRRSVAATDLLDLLFLAQFSGLAANVLRSSSEFHLIITFDSLKERTIVFNRKGEVLTTKHSSDFDDVYQEVSDLFDTYVIGGDMT